jgi:hypothetical protein
VSAETVRRAHSDQLTEAAARPAPEITPVNFGTPTTPMKAQPEPVGSMGII